MAGHTESTVRQQRVTNAGFLFFIHTQAHSEAPLLISAFLEASSQIRPQRRVSMAIRNPIMLQ